jgi:hypothetical protein
MHQDPEVAFHLHRAPADAELVQPVEVVGDLGGYEEPVAGAKLAEPFAGAAEFLSPLLQVLVELRSGRQMRTQFAIRVMRSFAV